MSEKALRDVQGELSRHRRRPWQERDFLSELAHASHWKHHGQDEPGNDEINRAFDETIERILQRFFAQGHKTKSAVLEVDHGMTQRFLQVAEDD